MVAVGVNLALAVACLWLGLRRAPRSVAGPERTLLVKTNVVLRKQFFSWAQVEATDYPSYIENLRAIGCPEQTIRDIIIADVNTIYSRRLATEITTPEQQWWRSDPDPKVARAAMEKLRALEAERRTLLTELLGPSWESGDLISLPRPTRRGVALDGPVLGLLSADAKQAVQDADTRASERYEAYLAAQRANGQSPDPAEVARLRKQAREELARILTPTQMEEYLLRNSPEAASLRADLGELKFFNATPDEFRALFRATDGFDQKIQLLAGATDPNAISERTALEQQRENAIKIALGTARYRQLQSLQDPMYRDAYAAAQQAGSPEAAQTLYEISLAAADQEAALRAKTNLTPEQLAIALQRAKLDQLKANAQALGQEVPEDAPAPAPPAPAPVPPLEAPATPLSQVTHPHVLGIGENAASLSMLYGIPINALRAANPGVDWRNLRPGDSVSIPNRP